METKLSIGNISLLIICIALPITAGGISGAITAKAISGWYATAQKAKFNPPNYIFGPVWTVLYLLMGISLYLVIKHSAADFPSTAVLTFAMQRSLNFFWSIIFFYWKRPGLAFVEIIVLWVIIAAMIFVFYKIWPLAAYLQVPYLCWVSFATILNAAFWHLNR